MHRRLACLALGTSPFTALAAPAPPARPVLRIAAVWKDPTSWIAARLLEQVYQQCDQLLRIELLPPPRASLEMSSGQADGELVRVADYGRSQPTLLRVEPALYAIHLQAFALPAVSLAGLQDAQDLRRYRRVGGVRGVNYVQEMTVGHPDVTLAQNAQLLFRMLQAGRIDVALIGRIAGRYACERIGLREVQSSPTLARYELFHYLHARHRPLAETLGAAIARLRAGGELARLTAVLEAQVMGIDVDAEPATPLP